MAAERFFSRVFSIALAALLAYLLWLILRPFFGPILWALLLAFLLYPANAALCRKLGGRPGLAALLMTLGVTLGIVIPAALLALIFTRQAGELVTRLSDAASRYHLQRPEDIFQIPALDRVLQWINQRTPVSMAQLREWLTSGTRNAVEFLLAGSRVVVLGALGAALGLFLMLFILYFFFRDGEEMAGRLLRLLPAPEARKRHLVAHLSNVTKAVVSGSLLTALIQGALVGIAFAIAGLSSPVVFGVLAAIASLLPVGGTALVWGPGAIVLWAQGHWGRAIFLAVWGAALVGSADNLLRPLFISGRAQISTLPVFLGVVGGLGAFGLIGIFLGPVLIALALALASFAEEARTRASVPTPPV